MNLCRRNVLHGLAALPAGGLLSGRPRPGLHAAVFNGPELQAALSAAGPGSVLELAPGDYGDAGGRFVLASRGVRVQARSWRHAVLRAPLVIEGDEAEADGLALTEGMHLAADGLSIVNVRFTGEGLRVTGVGTSVTACEFVAIRGGGVHITGTARNAYIRSNWFHDPVGPSVGSGSSAIQVGLGTRDTDKVIGAVVDGNTIERWRNEAETISVKSSGNYIRGNVLRDCRNLTNRHGERNEYVGNLLERCENLVIQDRGNRLTGNQLSSSKAIRIMGGDRTPDESIQGGQPQAVGTYLVNNVGKLIVGFQFPGDTLAARDTVIVSHSGQIELRAHENTQLPA